MKPDYHDIQQPRSEVRDLLRDVLNRPEQTGKIAYEAEASKRSPWKPIVLGGAVALVAGGIYLASRHPAETVPPARNDIRKLNASDASPRSDAVFDATGFVVAARRATVSADTTGRLARVFVSEGSLVRRGDVLALLDTRDLRQQMALAETELASIRNTQDQQAISIAAANDRFQRVKQLKNHGFATDAAYMSALYELQSTTASRKQAQGQIKVAEREVAIRRQYLRNAEIVAPFDGLVTETAAQPGEIVSPISAGGGFTRTGICTLVDMNSLEVRVQVNEKYIARVHIGQAVSMKPRAYSDLKMTGHVVRTMPAASRETGAVEVVLAFDARDERVLPNMSIDVSFLETGKAT